MMRRAPMGAKMMPMMRSVGRTVFGVRIGCQALSRCCLNAVSMQCAQQGVSGKVRKTHWPVASNSSSLFWAFLLEELRPAGSSSHDGREP